MSEEALLIIGGGQAAYSLILQYRELDSDRPITLIELEDQLPYQRPPLSKAYMTGQESAQNLPFRDRNFYEKHRVDLRLGRSVASVDVNNKSVILDDATSVSFGDLVFATGAEPFMPPIPGNHYHGVVTLYSISDAEQIRESLMPGKRIACIGGGFIGLELAAIAVESGAEVTVIEMAERLMSRVVSEETAGRFQAAHAQAGVELVLGKQVTEVVGENGAVSGVKLADGSIIVADLVVLGVGATPRTDVAKAAGLETRRGIIVDDCLRTEIPHLYAIGDCAEMVRSDGKSYHFLSVQNATDQGRHLARVLAGDETAYKSPPWFWTDQLGMKLQISGDMTMAVKRVFREQSDRKFSVFGFDADDMLVAVESVNQPGQHMAMRRVLSSGTGITLSDLTHNSFDLKLAFQGIRS